MGDDRHLETGGAVDGVGEPTDVASLRVAANRDGDGQRIGAVTHRILRRCDQLANPVIGREAPRLDDERRISGILAPQMTGGAGLNTDVVWLPGHHTLQGAGKVGEPAFANVTIPNEVIDGRPE